MLFLSLRKTSFKYGIVIRGEEGQLVDCASIFRKSKKWYMVYVGATNKIGYETYLACSNDLLHWEKLGKIMSFWPDGQRVSKPFLEKG